MYKYITMYKLRVNLVINSVLMAYLLISGVFTGGGGSILPPIGCIHTISYSHYS